MKAVASRKVVEGKLKTRTTLGTGPGLVVKGEDSCSAGHGFESQHCILAGHFHIDLL